MRRWLVVTLLCTSTLVAAPLPSGAADSTRATVAWVTDGDTLTLTSGERVRLLQIDAPEVGTGECYAQGARKALLALAPVRSRVTLEGDPALDRIDRYGRLLRYVRSGRLNVNLELVKRGAAAPYFYRGERGRHASRLLAAAMAAKAHRVGLWGAFPRTKLDPYRQLDTGDCHSGSAAPQPLVPAPPSSRCDPSYVGACVPPYPPDLDCADLRALGLSLPVRAVGSDPHGLDGDGDGYGCERG